MYGSPIKKSTMVAFEGPLGIKVIGSAANMTDFVTHSKKSLGIFGETKLVNLANIDKVKNNKIQNLLSYVPLLKVFTKETGPGLFLPQLSDENKEKDDYKYSIVTGIEKIEQIQQNYSKILPKDMRLSDKGIESLINNSHGTYTYESAAIAENIGKKLEEYKVASPARKGEFGKKYDYGNYQDKGLSKNKEMNISPQSYVKKKNSTIIDINEYLRNLRKGVDR